MPSRPTLQLPAFLGILTAGLWVIAVGAWIVRIGRVLGPEPFRPWLLDWHVYAAGGQDFLARTLYHVPLESPYNIPVSSFNLPPAAAVTVLPFLVFPDDVGGTLWVLLNVAAVGAAAVLTTHLLRLRYPWLWAGAIFALYSISEWGVPALLGNNSPLVLLLVAGFVAVHLANRPVAGGLLLGVAIATKLWPATFLVVLARERDWRTFGWAAGTAAAITVVLILWLGGLSVIGPMVAALQVRDEIGPDQIRARHHLAAREHQLVAGLGRLCHQPADPAHPGQGHDRLRAGHAGWHGRHPQPVAALLGDGHLRRPAARSRAAGSAPGAPGKTPHARRVDAPALASETRPDPGFGS